MYYDTFRPTDTAIIRQLYKNVNRIYFKKRPTVYKNYQYFGNLVINPNNEVIIIIIIIIIVIKEAKGV